MTYYSKYFFKIPLQNISTYISPEKSLTLVVRFLCGMEEDEVQQAGAGQGAAGSGGLFVQVGQVGVVTDQGGFLDVRRGPM